MTSEDIEFEAYLREQMALELQKVTKDAEEILKNKVESNVYNSYDPVSYQRTNSLKESITSKCDDEQGIAYFDEDKLEHRNAFGENTKLVPEYLNFGHTDSTGINNMWHNYPRRHFVEDTISELEEKYGGQFKFEIVED